jgi:rhamnose transport system permease protein
LVAGTSTGAILAIGLGLGIVNGLLVAVARIPAIIATLATLAIFRGIDAELTGGENITAYQLPDRFLQLNHRRFRASERQHPIRLV